MVRTLDRHDTVRRLETALYASGPPPGEGTIMCQDGWLMFTEPKAPTHVRNAVVRSVLDDRAVDQRITETVAHYRRIGSPFRWVITPSSRPQNLGDRLLARGFHHLETRVGMTISPTRVAAPQRDDIEVVVVGERALPEWLRVAREGWDLQPHTLERFRRVMRQDFRGANVAHLLARVGGEAVGCASFRLIDDFAHLFGATTLPTHRRQGIYRELLRTRLAWLRRLGIQVVTSHNLSTTSAPICRQLGFKSACEFEVFVYE